MKKFLFIFFLFFFTIISFSIVVNKNNPLKGTWDFNKELLWEEDSAGKDVFGDIQNIAISNDNAAIFVADMKHSLIFMFDDNGKFVKSLGKKGEGPGELREYFGGDQLHISGNKLIFADRALLHYFDLSGNYIKTIQYSPNLKPREFIDEDTFISAPATVDTRGGENQKIVLFNMKTNKKTDLASFRPFEKATDTQESEGSQITVGIVIGDITPLMQIRYKNKFIYFGMSDKNEVNVCDLKGKKILSFSNPDKRPHKVSDQYKKDLKARIGEVPENMLNNIINGLPANASFFSNIHVDMKGNIYLFESDPDSKSKKVIDIYNKKGVFIYRSEIAVNDDRSIGNVLIKGNYLYITTEDEEGNVAFSRYRITLPE